MDIAGVIVRQASASGRTVEKLPDGSTAVFESDTDTVHALDASAAAAFEACQKPTSVSTLMNAMRQSLGKAITEEAALEAVSQLEGAGLVTVSGGRDELRDSRRRLLKAAGIAVPVVLSLTALEQRAFALGSISTKLS
jgi:hypothetical protein